MIEPQDNSTSQDEVSAGKKENREADEKRITPLGTDDLNSDNNSDAGKEQQKNYGDTQLNKGLESQAKDEES